MGGSLTYPPPRIVQPNFVEAFGHSYLNTTVGTLDQTGRIDGLIRQALDIDLESWRNHAVTGAQLTVQARYQGGHATVFQEILKSQRTAPYLAAGGAYLGCWGINDIGFRGNTTQIRTAWKNALRMFISRARASSIREETDASIAYGAGFTSAGGTSEFTSGTAIRQATATTNANMTITIPADFKGGTIALCFVGASGVFGGSATIAGSAGATGTVSTSNIMPGASATHCPIVVRVTGLTAGNAGQTITVTVNSLDAGGSFAFDCYWIEAVNPNPVIMCNVARCLTAGYATYPTWSGSQAGADTDVSNFNADLASVVAEFDSMVQIADLDSALNKDLSLPPGIASYYASDGIHPNEAGAAVCAQAVVTATRRLAPLPGYPDAEISPPASSSAGTPTPHFSGQWCTPEYQALGTGYTAIAGDVIALPIFVSEAAERWSSMMVEVTTAPSTNATSLRLGLYNSLRLPGKYGYPGALITDITAGGALSLALTTGVKTQAMNWPVEQGLQWLVMKVDATGTGGGNLTVMRSMAGPTRHMPGWLAAGGAVTPMGWILTGVAAGTLTSTLPTFTAGAAIKNVAPALGVLIN
jgi:hypothetical protein